MIIHQIVIISLLVFAIHYTMQEGEIFGFIEKWWKKMEDELLERADEWTNRIKEVEEKSAPEFAVIDKIVLDNWKQKSDSLIKKSLLLEKLSQPLFRCPVCMAPWHGTYLYWLIPWERMSLLPHGIGWWVLTAIGALGLNAIIVKVFKDD